MIVDDDSLGNGQYRLVNKYGTIRNRDKNKNILFSNNKIVIIIRNNNLAVAIL